MQRTLFRTVNGNVTINHHLSSHNESRTEPATVKLTATEKKKIQEFCFENDLSVSDFMRSAVHFYYEYYDHGGKLMKYKSAILGLLDELP